VKYKRDLDRVDPKVLELSAVELCVPAHMLFLMGQSVVSAGYQLRPDTAHRLNVAAAAPLADISSDQVRQRAAKRTDDIANKVLFALSPDDPVHGLYCCAMFCLMLVDEGFLADAQNMAVLVSAVLIDDLRTEGGVDKYVFKEFLLKTEAGKLLSKCREEGIYKFALARKSLGEGPTQNNLSPGV
jgi:hypothetical protein